MITAKEKVINLIKSGDNIGAMRIASKWANLGNFSDEIKTAWDAKNHSDFYRQMKLNPDRIWAVGVEKLRIHLGVS